MALAKDRTSHELGMVSVHPGCLIYGNVEEVSDLSSAPGVYELDDYHKAVIEEGDDSEKSSAGLVKPYPITHTFWPMSYQPQEAHSVINFRPRYENFMHNSTGSLLSFEQNDSSTSQTNYTKVCRKDDYSNWEDDLSYDYQNQLNPKLSPNSRMLEDFNCFQATGYVPMSVNTSKENQHGHESLGCLYTEATTVTDSIQESAATKESCFHKRPYTVYCHGTGPKLH